MPGSIELNPTFVLLATLALFVFAAALFVWDRVRPNDLTKASPWFAVLALLGFGSYMYFSNAVDETVRISRADLSGCKMEIGAPAQVRTTSGIIVEATLDNEKARSEKDVPCTTVLRNSSLIVDGTASRDDFPIVLEDHRTKRRWFPASPGAGKHRLDVISKEALGSFTAAATVQDKGSELIGKANLIEGCNTMPVLPDASTAGQFVTVDIKVTCGQTKDLVPTLFVNGTALKPLASTDVNETHVVRYVFARTKVPDRIDAVVADVADDWSTSLVVREPATLNNVKEWLGQLTAVIAGLGALIVALGQFFRGTS